jgi:putative redox protein
MEQTLAQLNRALLIFHSPLDEIVSIDNAARLFEAARHPKSFVSLDDADHLLSRREDSLYVGMVLAAWARKYLGMLEDDQPPAIIPDNHVLVRTGRTGYQTEIIANGHRFIADEPIAVGGSGTGPNPYDYLVTALGACTSMTLRMYADRKNWPLDEIVVRLKHEKMHAADCHECETREGKIDVIERQIELVGPLDFAQKQRLVEIADRCPVHRMLHGEIVVKTWLKE